MANPLAALGSVGSLMSGAASLLKNNSSEQYRYQTMLNRQQQAYARENRQAELSNQYQYQFNLPLLNKKGMQAAGYSLAGISDGNVSSASTPNTASPSAGSAPTGATDVQAQLGVANLLQQMSLVKAQTENVQEETRGKKIKNDVDASSIEWDKELRKSESLIKQVEASNAQKYGDRKANAEMVIAEITSWIKDNEFYLGGSLTQANLDIAKQTLLNLKETCTLLKKQGFQVDKQMSLIDANIRSLDAGTAKTKAETTGISLDNDYKRQTLDARVAMTKSQEVRALLDSYPKTVREAAYSIMLNPELYPYVIEGLSDDELKQLRKLNEDGLKIKDWIDLFIGK